MDGSDSDESEREHQVDTVVDESGSDVSEREHPDHTDMEETDLGKTEREKPDDTDVKANDSGEKEEDENEEEDHHITIIPRNGPQNSYKMRSLTSCYLRNHNRNRPYFNVA